jgi:hypothetical protein
MFKTVFLDYDFEKIQFGRYFIFSDGVGITYYIKN